MEELKRKRAELIQQLRATNDLNQQHQIKKKIDWLEFLNKEIERLKKEEIEWQKLKKDEALDLVWQENIHEISRLLNRYTAEVEAYTDPKYNPDEITQIMIENAREYPIDRIIKVNERGFAVCPFHNDKNPSAYCRNNYLFNRIIKVNERGFAICPFHNDKNPSAYCRNNYLYCFSCGEQADTIKLAMKLWNTSFPLTVKKLQ